jgi:hypothetical protein
VGLPRLEREGLVIYRFRAARLEYARMSHQTACRKTFKEKLRPTPTQERELGRVLGHCRTLYNTALERRVTSTGADSACGDSRGCLRG